MQSRHYIEIVVPVINEEQTLPIFLERINAVMQQVTNVDYSFIFIDDGSEDGTWRCLQQLGKNSNNIRAISFSRNFGKESAICAGLAATDDNADAVVVMDVDLQHPPALLPEMIQLWRQQGFKLVEAIKHHRGSETWLQKLGAGLFYQLMSKAIGYDLSGTTDYKLLDKQVVKVWKKMPERATFFRGMSAWMGFPTGRISFSVPDRYAGQSNWNFFTLLRLATNAITSFTALPLHLVTMLGILFSLFAIILGLQTFYVYLSGDSVDGFATVILLLLIIGASLSLSLGIIGIYLSRIYEEIKARPRYIIEKEITNQNKTTIK